MSLVRSMLGETGALPLRRLVRAVRLWWQKTFQYRLRSVGKGVIISAGTTVRPNCVDIGDYTFIGPNCALMAGDLKIGRFVMLAAEVAIVGGDHRIDVAGVPSIRTGRAERKPVVIEDDVWIGRGAMIMHGIRIGEGAIVAAGALVTKDVEPYAIVGSPPARVIGQRFADPEQIARHRRMLAALRERDCDFSPDWEAFAAPESAASGLPPSTVLEKHATE